METEFSWSITLSWDGFWSLVQPIPSTVSFWEKVTPFTCYTKIPWSRWKLFPALEVFSLSRKLMDVVWVEFFTVQNHMATSQNPSPSFFPPSAIKAFDSDLWTFCDSSPIQTLHYWSILMFVIVFKLDILIPQKPSPSFHIKLFFKKKRFFWNDFLSHFHKL